MLCENCLKWGKLDKKGVIFLLHLVKEGRTYGQSRMNTFFTGFQLMFLRFHLFIQIADHVDITSQAFQNRFASSVHEHLSIQLNFNILLA